MIKKNIHKISFGKFIREQRIKNGFGQRELATKIGIAASYLNDIEKEKRTAPKKEIILKISRLLKINIDMLNDLVGRSKGNIAPDIIEFINNNPSMVSLVRTIKSRNLNEDQIFKSFDLVRIKEKNKWYCSEWILYALRISNIID